MNTFPSSDPDAIKESLNGDQSVSRTGAVWPRKSGIDSGRRPRWESGMTAKAPPPPDSQLTERYDGLALMMLESQAFFEMWLLQEERVRG